MTDGRGPSRAWYVVGGAVVAVGVGIAALLAVTGFRGFTDRIDDFQRVPLGGESAVVFERAGGYTLYYERPFSDDGGDSGFVVALVPEGGSEPVPMSEYGSEVTYDVGRRHGRALYSFRINEPGRYVLKVGNPGGRERAETGEMVAVGRGLGRGIVVRVFATVFSALFGFAGGAAIVIVTAVKRHAARPRPPPQPGPSSR